METLLHTSLNSTFLTYPDSLVTQAEVCIPLVTFSFQVQISRNENVVTVEQWFQNTKLGTLAQYVAAGECCFEAYSDDVTVGSW